MKMSVILDGLFRTNDTFDYDDDYWVQEDAQQSRAVWLTVLYSLVTLVGLLGNGLLLFVLARRRGCCSVSDVFVLYLSLADVQLLVTLPFWAAQAAQGYQWRLGVTLCRISGAVFNVNFFCGILTLTCLSMFLYLSMVHTKKLCIRPNLQTAHMSCVLVWTVSLLLTIPDWFFLGLKKMQTNEGDSLVCVPNYYLSEHQLGSRVRHHVVGMVATLLICVLCVLLWLQSANSARRRRAVMVVVVLVTAFLVCWLPFSVTLLVDTLRISSDAADASTRNTWSSLDSPLMITSAFACAHACLRPLLYFGLCRNFRERTLAALRCGEVEGQGSLWELGVAQEAPPVPSQQPEELTQMTSTEQQVQSAQ